MRITKYVHSCLLVETPARVGIIDPGIYSWQSGLLDITALERLDDIVITHEHSDHMYLPFITALLARFPGVTVVTTPAVAGQLGSHGIVAGHTSTAQIELFTAPHESTRPLWPPPQSTGVHYLGVLTHPGDCHHFAPSKEVLALPVTAPWGTIMRAAELVLELRPKYVIPIHDWQYRDEARQAVYDNLEHFFGEQNIVFIKPRNGVAFELADIQ